MVTNIITNLKGSERGSERDAEDLSWTTWIREERKRERGQTVLLTGLALALAACGGGGSSGGGGTPTQRASLAISEGADTGTAGDGVTNAAEVVLSVGQAPEGAVVRITRDGTQVGELLRLAGGTEVRFASGIVEGQTGTFVATVLTSETNDRALSGAYEFTVDRELPAEVTLGTTELGTVDNPMVRGEITQIEGTGEAGAKVQVRLGEELLGEAKVGEDGTWVVTLDEAAQARLKAGENVLGIVQVDEAGNVSGQRTQRVHVEVEEANRVAQLSLISDTGETGDGITNGETVMLGVSAVEGKTLPAEAVVRITRDGVPVGELLELTAVTQGFEISFASGIGKGQTGTFVATVLASRTNETVLSRGYEFTVDREIGRPEITMGLGTASVPMVREEITQIEGTGEAGAKVQVRFGEELLGEARVGEDGTWVLELDEAARARFTVGENVLGIEQEDVAGNVSEQRTQSLHVEVEEANRVARLSLVSDTGVTGDDITNGETVVLGVSAVEGKTLPAEAVVRITRDGVPAGELLELTTGTQGFETSFASQIGEGQTGTFVATVVASATDETVLSRGYEFTVDRQPPEEVTVVTELGTMEAPVARRTITQVEGTGEAGTNVRVKLREELLREAIVGEDGTWVVTLDEAAWARFTVGENVLGIEQEDVAGNVSEQKTQRLYVKMDEANRVAQLSLINDTGVIGDDITNGETVMLGVSAVEGTTLPTEAVVRITRDGTQVGELLGLTSVTGGAEVRFASQIVEGQTGTFVATVLASETNDTALGGAYEFTVDRELPAEVTVTTELGTGEAPVARRTITQIEGTGETGAKVRVRLGEELLGEARVGEDGTWVVTLDEAARARFTAGENVLGIEQEDVAGNVSEQRTQRVYLEVEEANRVARLSLVSDTGVTGDDITNGETVVLGVSAVEGKTLPAGAVVRITRDGAQVGELLELTSVTGGAEVRFASQIVEGQTGTFVATVLASETNDTALGGAYEFTVDRELPAEVTVTTELGTMEVPVARRTITQVEGTGEAGAKVQVRLGEELLGEARVEEDGTWVVTLDEAARDRFTVGENVLGIEQEDVAGNVSEQRAQRVYLEVEEANRVARLSLVSDTGVTGDDITNGETVMLGVSAVEGTTLPAEAVVRITRDGARVGELLELTTGTQGFESSFASGIGEGQTGTFVATVVASATDETVISEDDYTFTVDRQPPEEVTVTTELGTIEVPVARRTITQVEGTGEAGAKVQVRLGEELLGEARVGEDGTWVVTLDEAARARFTVGENVLGIEQEDVAGNVSEQRAQRVYLDEDLKMEIVLVSDTGVVGDDITNGETVMLGITAREGTLPEEAVVRITRDGEQVGELIGLTAVTQGFEISFASGIGEGQTGTFVATVLASATDETVISEDDYTFTVDRQTPEAPAITTENLGTVEAPVSRSEVLGIVGTGEAGARVKVKLGEEEIARAEVKEDGTFEVTWDQEVRDRLSEGVNTLEIEQEDEAGNVSEGVDWVVVVKEDPPASIKLSEDTDRGSSNSDGITNIADVKLEVTAQEGVDLGEAVVQITKEGVVVATLELNGETSVGFSSGIAFGQEGTFVARVLASATDDTPLSAAYEFTVDQQNPNAPTITTQNVGTSEDPVFRSELPLRFEGTGEAGGTVTLLGSLGVSIGEDGRWVMELDMELDEAARNRLREGENTLIFQQEDVAGNENFELVGEVTVWVKEDAPVEVKIENDTGVQGDDITSEQAVVLVFTPAQGAPDLTNAVVQITKEGEIIQEGLALTSNEGEFQISVDTGVLEGQTGTFVARVLTSATDDTPLGVRYEFTVDRQTPEAPMITTENLGTVEVPVFRGDVLGIAGTGEAGARVKVRLGEEVIAQTEVREDGTFGVTWDQEAQSRLSGGLNTLEIVQEDGAGNVSEGVDWVVVVKDAAVSIKMAEGSDRGASNSDGITSRSDVNLEVTAQEGVDLGEAVVQITKEGVVVETLELNGGTNVDFSSGISFLMGGQEGTFVARVLVSATDDTPLTAAYEFTVDRIRPEAPTITTQNVGTEDVPVFRSELPLQFEGTGEAGGTVLLNIVEEGRVSNLSSATIGEDGRWVLELDEAVRNRLQVGENTLAVMQRDVAGNEGASPAIKVWVKSLASIRVSEGDDSGASNSDGITNKADVNLEVTAQEGVDLSEAVVQITRDGVVVETLELNGETSVDFSSGISFLMGGQEGTFVARVLASATDETVLSEAYEFTVDRISPDQPTIATQNVGTQEDPLFRSDVRFEGTGEVGGTVYLFIQGVRSSGVAIGEDGRWVVADEVDWKKLGDGENALLVQQQDVAGNFGLPLDATVWVKSSASIKLAEEDDTGVSNSDGITNAPDVYLNVASVGGGDLDRDKAVVQITKEGVVVQTVELNGETRVRFLSDIVVGQEETYVAIVLASATDDTQLSASYEFTMDRQAPEAPTITTQNVGTQEDPMFRSEVRFEGTGEVGAKVYLAIELEGNIHFLSVSDSIGEDGRWVLELNEAGRNRLQVGENTLLLQQQDVVVNVSVIVRRSVWVKEDGSAVEVRKPVEEAFVETEYAQEYAEILGVNSGEDTFYG